MPAEESIYRELDILREQHDRDVDRVEREIQACVTNSFYVEAQKQVGERIGGLASRVTAIETKAVAEKQDREKEAAATKKERDREKFQVRLMLAASGIGLLATIAAELLRIVYG